MSTSTELKVKDSVSKFAESERELVVKKLDHIDNQIKKGKRKLLSPKQALGKYLK